MTNSTAVRFPANDPIFDKDTRTVSTTRPYNVKGMDGKLHQVSITKTASADIPKVGTALSKFTQRVDPLAMGIATLDLICSLSNICNQNDEWFFEQDSLPAHFLNESRVEILSSIPE
ncbi:MAG: hypothetical protein KIT26_12025, partial [Nitrosomonas sp.]|nr:hypothetical protein [Nitrosomonas sp.]